MWFTRRGRRERDLDDEIGSHLRMAAEDRIADGDEPGSAHAAARREFGNVGLVKEITRDGWGWNGFGSEFRSAWRNVKARQFRAVLIIVLLSLAIGVSTVLFSFSDSLVFHRVTYRDPETLVHIQTRNPRGGSSSAFQPAARLEAWRAQTDLFSEVHGSLSKVSFLLENDRPEAVGTADVTPGLVEMLGILPRWGRSLTREDAVQKTPHVVLISERIARQRFGDPAAAIGRTLQTADQPFLVAGVMPDTFRFPSGNEQIWRALDPRGELARGFAGTSSIARMRPGLAFDAVSRAVEERSSVIGEETGAGQTYSALVSPLSSRETVEQQRQMVLVLFGAALCLLLTACANVAGLELASAVQRTRTYALHLALGASRIALVRIALLEGAVLFGTAGMLAVVIGAGLTNAFAALLPPPFLSRTVNPIDFDERAALFLLAVTALGWGLTVVPLLRHVCRTDLLDILKLESAGAIGSRSGSLARRTLAAAELGVAVALMIGGLLYVRTYQAFVGLEKGFDSTNVATVSLTLPPQLYPSFTANRLLANSIVEAVRGVPGVSKATFGSPPPNMGAVFAARGIGVDGSEPIDDQLRLAFLSVNPDYFSVLGIPLQSGRSFEVGEPSTNVIVSEATARRFWPDGAAVGHTFQWEGRTYSVIAVVGTLLTEPNQVGAPPRTLQLYEALQPPPPGTSTRGAFGFIDVTVRLDSRRRAADVMDAVRRIEQNAILNLEFIDDVYARQYGAQLFATQVVGGFGVLAFAVSAVGLYGVMAFLVATRRREIGLRMALGAAPSDVLRWVMSSSARLVIPGIVLGLVGALVGARWIESQLFGVSALDPSTYIIVATVVLAGAMLATWYPARQAARVDPIVVLRD